MIDYQRVAKAITYINEHATEQPTLDDIAEAVHLSPYHFHRLFKEWAGVTPKTFLQYINLEQAKKLLNKHQTIEEVSFHTGLSSTSRLHDLFVNIEGMTPGEFKNGGENLDIWYHFAESLFGEILIASTKRGICNLVFVKNDKKAGQQLRETWPHADIKEGLNRHIEHVKNIFSNKGDDLKNVKLHIRGSNFQLKVWEALLRIPAGKLMTYSDVAEAIDNPNASRAVGSALARNPVAYLIPCHRVIKKTGGIGEYRWGHTRKTAIIGWEMAQIDEQS